MIESSRMKEKENENDIVMYTISQNVHVTSLWDAHVKYHNKKA